MSRKSKRKMSKREIERGCPNSIPLDILAQQTAGIKIAAYDYLGGSLLFAVMAIVVFLVGFAIDDKAHSYRVIFGAAPGLLGFAIFFFVFFWQRFSVFRKIKSVQSLNEQSVSIHCAKIRVRTHPISRSSSCVLYILFIDENKQKYYYIYPKDSYTDGHTVKSLRSSLQDSTIDLVCYRNTNIVKSFQKQEQ